jgi:DNA-binding NtrC family response regulator
LLEMRKSHPNAKSIAFSGGGKIDGLSYLLMAKRLGAKWVLPKPFTIDTFMVAVRDTLEADRLTAAEFKLRDVCSAEIQDAIEDHPIPST